jgi:NADP-dependent 3-hydroxy acid dehydrogenase YdfG
MSQTGIAFLLAFSELPWCLASRAIRSGARHNTKQEGFPVKETTNPRTWFITGASSGVGQALSMAVLERGERVAAVGRNAYALRDLALGFPGQVLTLPADVRDEQAMHACVAGATKRFHAIDVVVNAAGYALLGPVEEISDKQAHENFDTNFFGVLNLMRAVLPVMREQRSGHVVQMSSVFGHITYPGTGLLAATKHAVSAITEALALELEPFGITFSLMEPGGINTQFMRKGEIVEADTYAAVGDVISGLVTLRPDMLLATRELAEAIIKTADAAKRPLRVALGPGAEDLIRQTLVDRLRAMDAVGSLVN